MHLMLEVWWYIIPESKVKSLFNTESTDDVPASNVEMGHIVLVAIIGTTILVTLKSLPLIWGSGSGQ